MLFLLSCRGLPLPLRGPPPPRGGAGGRVFLRHNLHKAVEGCHAFGGALVDARVREDGLEDFADLVLEHFVEVFGLCLGVLRADFLVPCGVALDFLDAADVFRALDPLLLQRGHLFLEARRQHGEAHDLDEADILFLDVVNFLMRMEDAERILVRRAVVAQHEVELVALALAAGDWRDRVVRRAVRLSEDVHGRVAVGAPCVHDLRREVDELVAVDAREADRRHRPLHAADLDVRETGHRVRFLDGRLCHGERVAAALVVVMREDGTADDREVCIRAEEVVRQNRHEVQEVLEAAAADLHRDVLAIQDDAVLVVVRVRAVLHEPAMAGEADRDQAVRLARRMADVAGIAFVFAAEQALRVFRRFLLARLCDVARVFLRLRQVDRDVEITVLRRRLPDDILVDAVLADVVRRDGHLVELVGRGFRAAGVVALPAADDLGRARHHAVHDARVKEVALLRRVLEQALFHGIVEHFREDGQRRRQLLVDIVFRRELADLQQVDEAVCRIVTILFLHELALHGEMKEAVDFMIDGHRTRSFLF